MKFDDLAPSSRTDPTPSGANLSRGRAPVAIVTGGTHGIGRESVLALGRAGWTVVFQGRDEMAGRGLAELSDRFVYVSGDITASGTVERLVAAAGSLDDGKIAGLVNNVGRSLRKRFADSSLDDWDDVFALNGRSVFAVTHAALPGLRSARGSVVFVSSVAGQDGEEGLSIYCASKAALIGLAKSLAIELGEEVRFNTVCPGQIATRMMDRVLRSPELSTAIAARIPQRRVGLAGEVAAVIAWLLSPESSFVNGAVVPIDGGESAGLAALPIPAIPQAATSSLSSS
jgi:NAD(P)-dependent dehydrogenase (short-subunit alcohol dehydrogenase family)